MLYFLLRLGKTKASAKTMKESDISNIWGLLAEGENWFLVSSNQGKLNLMKFGYYQEGTSYHHGPKTFSALHAFPRLQKPLTEGKHNNSTKIGI
jgi:hypothetical protein